MKKVSEELLYESDWLQLLRANWKHENGKTYGWDFVRRKHLRNAVVIIAKLKPSDRYVIIKEYRVAAGHFVIGFPAGLIEDKDVTKDAIRELKEETGFVSDKIIKVSPILDMNPAMTDATFQVVTMEIDETLEENINPIQELEISENIEVFLLKREDINDFLTEQQKQGASVGPAVWYYFTDF
jgi:ADP-ribose pyrophosphatase